MPKQGETTAQANRRIRQDALREQLKASGLLTQYVKNIEEIQGLDIEQDTFEKSLNKLKVSNEQRLKLINKVLPDEKFLEVEAAVSGELTISWAK